MLLLAYGISRHKLPSFLLCKSPHQDIYIGPCHACFCRWLVPIQCRATHRSVQICKPLCYTSICWCGRTIYQNSIKQNLDINPGEYTALTVGWPLELIILQNNDILWKQHWNGAGNIGSIIPSSFIKIQFGSIFYNTPV